MRSPTLGYAPPDSPTRQLARFVAELDYESVPEVVKDQAADILLDSIASALAGRHGDETKQIASVATVIGGQGTNTVIAGEPLSLLGAVLLNGYQVTAVTLCDMHVAALNHVTPGVISAALAMAEHVEGSGRDLLRSVMTGLECSVRVGLAINFPAFRERGWHSPGVIGPFGAAAATGSLLGLDSNQMLNAFGAAGSQSAGTYAAWGTPTVKFHQTRGGMSGVLAGLLAAEGFLSSQEILTHPDGGIFTTYSDGGHPEKLTDGLGEDWTFNQVNLRRWPAATQFQSIVEALLEMIDQHQPQLEEIQEANVFLPPDVFGAFGGFGWEDKFNARLSPKYVTAVVLADRQCWLDQFQAERLTDRSLTDFARDRVHIEADPTMDGVGARVELVMAGGATISTSCPVPKGDGTRPLVRADIVAKFHEARDGVLSDAIAEQFLEGITDLESVTDVTQLIGLLGAHSAQPRAE